MAWSATHNTNIIPNLDIVAYYNENNELQGYEVYPLEGYVVRIYALDEYQTDENGNFVLDENGNKILVRPWRIWGGATAVKTYDWTTNPKGFAAELYEEGMEIMGGTEPDHETM
jgi:hypothetical protein